MEFTLYYRGPLKATTTKNRRKREKHALRQHFHEQLKELWDQTPLRDHWHLLGPRPRTGYTGIQQGAEGIGIARQDLTLIREVGMFEFAPLVSDRLHMAAG